MNHLAPRFTALALVATLAACGGGGDSAAPPLAPPPVPAGKITLSPTNYRNASTLAMGVASTAFGYSRRAVEVVNALLNVPLNLTSQTYSYSVSGTVSSGALGGTFDFATLLPFTGVVGEYPAAGRMTLRQPTTPRCSSASIPMATASWTQATRKAPG